MAGVSPTELFTSVGFSNTVPFKLRVDLNEAVSFVAMSNVDWVHEHEGKSVHDCLVCESFHTGLLESNRQFRAFPKGSIM